MKKKNIVLCQDYSTSNICGYNVSQWDQIWHWGKECMHVAELLFYTPCNKGGHEILQLIFKKNAGQISWNWSLNRLKY